MDERLIIKQCQAGDKEAFGILYQTYLVPMRKIVAYYVHSPEAVWDILHDGFLIAFTSIGSLKKAEKVESWLTSIMKNLALQYLKEESNHISVPLSDISIYNETDNYSQQTYEMTWEELVNIISRLPEGYSKVFRMSVLDGMSHKEIGALLGIAPHSSSSQLAHAKAMLRRMIVRYRIETGIISIIGIIFLLWQEIFRYRETNLSNPVISKNTNDKNPDMANSITYGDNDSIVMKQTVIYSTVNPPEHELIADVIVSKDSIPPVENDSVANDTIRKFPNIIYCGRLIQKKYLPHTESKEKTAWSLSLAYSGNLGLNESNQYRMHNQDIPSIENPVPDIPSIDGSDENISSSKDPNDEIPSIGGSDNEIEVTEKTHHHMPVIIDLSLNKTLTSRWSIGTGIRYSFLRSDFLLESKLISTETIQRIHYIGIPLKFSYNILTYNDFSLYGQGGMILDIPVYGSRSVWKHSPEQHKPDYSKTHIHTPLQWSVEGGLGIQYHFTPSVSIYAEPSFRYYLNPGSEIKTLRQEKPFEFTIPVGLRLTW